VGTTHPILSAVPHWESCSPQYRTYSLQTPQVWVPLPIQVPRKTLRCTLLAWLGLRSSQGLHGLAVRYTVQLEPLKHKKWALLIPVHPGVGSGCLTDQPPDFREVDRYRGSRLWKSTKTIFRRTLLLLRCQLRAASPPPPPGTFSVDPASGTAQTPTSTFGIASTIAASHLIFTVYLFQPPVPLYWFCEFSC
jgi:hypothetical protein